MRRIVATLLVSALLTSAAPLARRDDGDRFDPIKLIKKIVRILVPAPADDYQPTPPKP
jgi:hypothetical protein